MIFHVGHRGFVGVMPGVKSVPSCDVRVMGGFFMVAAFMMFSRLCMVACSMRMVFRRILVVLSCFLGHVVFPLCFVARFRGRRRKTPTSMERSFATNR